MNFAPDRIGDHLILAEIGRGGMGVVYRARDERSGQEVALKMLAPEAQSHSESALRFKREFRAIRRVVHPNVVRVFEAGAYRGAPYFTMELVDGTNIRRWLDDDESLIHVGKEAPPAGELSKEQRALLNDPARTRHIAEATVQVCFALSAIHAHRIVHRDLKPDNILVTPQGVVKLMDFGIAKQLTEHGPSTSGGMVVGTFKYLSPEQALGMDIDGRADLYCMGIVLYELLAGRHPFYSETSVGYAYHHARTAPHPVTRFNPEVDPQIAAIAERLLSKEPADRYPTADDLIAAVKEAVSDLDERVQALKTTTKRSAVPPFQLSKDPLFAPALVGRDPEKQALLIAVDRLKTGLGRFVVIEGETGAGKSRLLRDVGVEARDSGVELLNGRAAQNERSPYAPFIDVFEQIVRQLQTRPRREIHEVLGSDGPVLARHLPAVAELPGVDKKPVAALAPEDEQIRFRAAVADVLGRFCEEQPRVLTLDNIHHADELTLDLVRHLAGTLGGLVFGDATPAPKASLSIFVTLDPSYAEGREITRPLLEALEGQPGYVHLRLNPIDVAAAGRLVRSMLGGEKISAALASALHADSGGLPYRVEERVRALAAAGDLLRRGRRWRLRARQQGDAQPSLIPVGEVAAEHLSGLLDRPEEAGAHRLAPLSSVARDLGARAAVVGTRLRGEVLFRVALRPEEEVLDALDELIKRDVLREEKGEGYYRFVNEDVRQALLEGLDGRRRERLHLLAAHSMEELARTDERAGVDPEFLATHYLAGGEALRAFDYLADAMRRALQANAIQAALSLAERMQGVLAAEAEYMPADPGLVRRQLNLLLLRLLAMLAAGRPVEVIGLASSELPLLRVRAEARLVAEATYLQAVAERELGELDSALSHVAEVMAVTERGGAHNLRCKVKRLAGEIYIRRGQPDRALRYYRETLELARAIGDDLEEELARGAMAAQRLETGELDAARRDYENLLGVAERKGERTRAAHYVRALGQVHHESGDYERALASFERAREMAKAIGDTRTSFIVQRCMGAVALDQGHPEEAIDLLGRARAGLMSTGATEEVIECLIQEAQVHLRMEQDQKARADCDEAVAEAERSGMAMLVAEARITRGLARARLRESRQGLHDIATGLSAARRADAARIVMHGLLCLAEAQMICGEQSRGLRHLEEGHQMAKQAGFGRYRDRVFRLRERLGITAPN